MIRRLTSMLAAATLVALASPSAFAEGGVLVVPLAGELSGDLADAPDRLTEVLLEAANEAGIEALRAEVSRAELAAIAGCPADDPACLLQVADTLGASKVLVGEVAPADGDATVRVSLTVVATGAEPTTHEIALRAASTDALAAELLPIARAIITGQPLPGAATADVDDDAKTDTDGPGQPDETSSAGAVLTSTSPADDRGGFDLSRVRGYSWGIAGGGVALATVGAIFLGIADGKQADVDDAATDTVADLEALADLEADGKRYNRLGNGMLIAGGAAAIVGAVLIIKQARTPRDSSAVSIAPVPMNGGAGVVFTWGLQ